MTLNALHDCAVKRDRIKIKLPKGNTKTTFRVFGFAYFRTKEDEPGAILLLDSW